jgi:hypothetical protein
MLLKEKNHRYIIRTGNNLSMEVEPTLVIYEDTLSILRKQLRHKINTNLYTLKWSHSLTLWLGRMRLYVKSKINLTTSRRQLKDNNIKTYLHKNAFVFVYWPNYRRTNASQFSHVGKPNIVSKPMLLMACRWPPSWEPQEEGMMRTTASLPSVWNQGLSNQ